VNITKGDPSQWSIAKPQLLAWTLLVFKLPYTNQCI
jgi:hypothetical protein